MRRLAVSVGLAAFAALVVAMPSLAAPDPGSSQYKPLLKVVGFDTLGPPSTGRNTDIVVDFERKFAYVGAIDFDFGAPIRDYGVKAVDVSDPTHPVVTDNEILPAGDTHVDLDMAGNILAVFTQGLVSSNPGVTLFDITDRADPVPVSHLDRFAVKGEIGSHGGSMWRDPLTGKTWLLVSGQVGGTLPQFGTSLMIFDVTNPASPAFAAEYDDGIADPFVHDNVVQVNDGRVRVYLAEWTKGVEILDITRIVRGGERGLLTFAQDVVAYNHYVSNPLDAATVTRPGFGLGCLGPASGSKCPHYIEPTASGNVSWLGDESQCGEPAILHAFDSSALPLPGGPKKFMRELGVIIENPDAPMCQGGSANAQTHTYRWTGHNFDVWGDDLLFRGDYGRGVYVYDISNPADARWVAKSGGLNRMVGAENKADPGREKAFDNYPWIWAAVYDGDLIYATDIVQGLYVLDLVGD